jgi:hypothetical protein
MKAYLFGAAAFGVLWASGAQADASAPKGGRSVQLISMTAAPAKTDGQEDEAGQDAIVPFSVDAGSHAEFRVHDLSRRWVEFQMASSLREQPDAQDAVVGQDPFAPVGVAQPWVLPAGGGLSPAASIAVPLWMRGGDVFASAASRYVPGCAQPAYRPTGFLRSAAEFRRANYYTMMSGIACEFGVPVGLFDAMIIRESQYHPAVYSPKNAYGLTQLMPGTAVALGVNRYSIEGNLRGGAKYLRQQLDQFGHYHLALAAYNAGPGRVRNGRVPQIAETQAYVDNVLLNWSRLSGLHRQATIVSAPAAPASVPTVPIGRKAAVSTF